MIGRRIAELFVAPADGAHRRDDRRRAERAHARTRAAPRRSPRRRPVARAEPSRCSRPPQMRPRSARRSRSCSHARGARRPAWSAYGRRRRTRAAGVARSGAAGGRAPGGVAERSRSRRARDRAPCRRAAADAGEQAAPEACRVFAAAGIGADGPCPRGPRRRGVRRRSPRQDLVVVAVPPAGRRPGARPARVRGLRARAGSAHAAGRPGACARRRRHRGAALVATRAGRARRGALVIPADPSDARCRTRESGQATILLIGLVLAVAGSARSCSAASRAGSAGRATSSAPPISRRSRARARCTTPTAGSSSPRGSAGAPTAAISSAPRTSQRGRRAALETARRNGAHDVVVQLPRRRHVRAGAGPCRGARRGRGRRRPTRGGGRPGGGRARAAGDVALWSAGPGVYGGPLAYRQGKPMRPDVAAAFDRMQAAARIDGVALIVVSAFRTDAEQAALFARHPGPDSGSRRRASRCIASAPSWTSARRRRTDGSPPTPSAFTSFSAMPTSRGTSGSR